MTVELKKRVGQSSIEVSRSCKENAWKDYVESHPKSKIFHTKGWLDLLKEAYDYDVEHLVASENNSIRGVLPVVRVKSWFFGDRYISLPFSDYAGPLVDSEAARLSLLDFADENMENTDYLEIRLLDQRPKAARLEEGDVEYITFAIDLMPDWEEIWMDTFSKKVRTPVRKAKREGASIRHSRKRADLEEFYSLYENLMKGHGTPPHSFQFFESILNNLGQNMIMNIVEFEGEVVGGNLLLLHNDIANLAFSVSSYEHRSLGIGDLVYAGSIQWAKEEGYRRFLLGRTRKGGGVYRFKKKYGGVELDMPYLYRLYKADTSPTLDPNTEEFQRKTELWRRFVPKSVARVIGPKIRRGIG